MTRRTGRAWTRRFCGQLAEARNPAALLASAARNFTTDELRARDTADISGDWGSDAERSAPAVETRYETDEPGPETTLVERVVQRRLRGALAEAKREDRLLLGVLFTGPGVLSDADVAVLAERRGVAPEVVKRELEARAERWFARERALRHEQAQRASERAVIRAAIRDVERVIDELGDPPDVPPATDVNVSDYTTRNALEAATPEIRAGILAKRHRMLAQKDEALAQLRKLLDKPSLANPAYDEVAHILGLLPAGASEQERKKVVNTVTVRWKRARQRLVELHRTMEEGAT